MNYVYDKNMFDSALYNSAKIDAAQLTQLMEPYEDRISGIWLPLITTSTAHDGLGGEQGVSYGKLLASAGLENSSKFKPCDCNDASFKSLSSPATVEEIYNSQELIMDDLGECSYCNSTCDSDPCDMTQNDNNLDKTFCDVRFNKDDYVPKIPYMYQGYISGFNDFKHLAEFPAASNHGLGFDGFIRFEVDENNFNTTDTLPIRIDWKLEEQIGEIPYDGTSSQHASEYIHEKAYKKSLKNKTVGNFLRKDKLKEGEFPPSKDFTPPYGFTNQTYDNLFHGDKRLGSHWKWNYQSGILGWYRHYDIEKPTLLDNRPIRGIDLYIPSGDIFHAKTIGPEVVPPEESAQACPSGLKLVNGTEFDSIVPHHTDFVYISTNIYPKFLEARGRIKSIFSDQEEILNKSLLLATHPEYDNIITDLYSDDVGEDRESVVGHLSTLNQFMTSGTDFVSAGNINYCRTADDLIKTLLHKYGCYYIIDSDTVLKFGNVEEKSSWYVDMNFDMVIKKNKNIFGLTSNSDTSFKFLPNDANYQRKFEYKQKIEVGDTTILKTKHNDYKAFNESCSIDEFDQVTWTKDEYINISSLTLFNDSIAVLSNNSGQYSFTDMYQAGRLQHDRIYPATVFNPHVDLLALHPQGGAYVNALPFDLTQKTIFDKNKTSSPGGELKVTFNTEDSIAIKLYSIKVKSLQSKKNDSKQYERFPYSQEEKCKCYGFNWPDRYNKQFYHNSQSKTWIGSSHYVPNLSTENSPTLEKYGGYSQDYLNSLFGEGVVITEKPNLIEDLISYIDPLNPYGIEQQTSVTLPNYVNSKWVIDTKNIKSDIHTDVIVEVSENVNLTANRFTGDPSDYEYTSNHNMSWKRFTTKVEVKGKEIYDKQAENIVVNLNERLIIKLHNPFLARLINDNEQAYAPPDNTENLISVSPKLYSTRGDESSQVTLTLIKKPKKHLLNFVIPPPTPYGNLTKGSFNPNDGLSNDILEKSPFINDRMYTEYRFNEGTTEKLENNKGIYYGNIAENMKKLCHQISNFDLNRKLRTYARVGSTWYQVASQKRGSYTVDDKQYLGRPRLFEYLKNTKNSKKIPMLYPAPPKKLFGWNFFLNHSDIDKESVSQNLQPSYPWLNGRNFSIKEEFIVVPGSRYYFLAEQDIKVTILTQPDPDNPDETIEIDGISDVTEGVTKELVSGDVIRAGGNYYFYNGGPKNEIKSYLFLGDRYEEIIGLSNNLSIDYSQDISDTSYVYNTFKSCDQMIIAFINNKGFITPISERYKIIGKELRVQGYDIENRPTINNPVKYRLYTVFQMNQSMQKIKDKVFGIDIANKRESTSLCIFHPNNTTDFSKTLRLDPYNNSRVTKWADVQGLSDPNQMTELITDDLEIKNLFPGSIYNNWFYKQIINNFEKQCDFQLFVDGKPYYYPSMDPAYCIFQKYNLEDPEVLPLKDAFLYQNFIPMMDITLHGKSAKPFFTNSTHTNIGIPIEGMIYSANWTKNLLDEEFSMVPPDADVNPGPERFWTEITAEDLIETAYVPTTTIYSDTLRIDDPTFWLDRISKQTTRNTQGVRTTFTPTAPILSSAGMKIQGFSHEIKKRDYAFSIQNIYGDGDNDEECGAQGAGDCFISTRGSVSLYAHLKIATPVKRNNLANNVSFYTTYDAGLYNPLGQKNLITISRSELETDNPLHSAFDPCSTSFIRPDYKRTIIDPERNNAIAHGNTKTQSLAVKNLDKYANEMLFRIMYGDEGDPVNRAILLSKKKPLTASDLVNFTDPKVTAADVYDEILYNYDTKASCGNFINNSFSVRGPMKIGDYYDFNIGSKNIYFSIEDYGEGDIRVVGRIGGQTINVKLAGGPSVKTGVTVTDVDTNLSNTANTTYTLKKTSSGCTTKYYGVVSGRIYTGKYAITTRDYGVVLQYGHHLGQHVNDIGYHGSIVPPGSSVSAVAISNGGTGFNYWEPGSGLHRISRWGSGSSSGGGTCPDKTCDDYEIGYCKRKSGCNTDACDGDEDMENFLYSFQQCRTTFNVYGHKYKIQTSEEETEETSDGSATPYPVLLQTCPSQAGKGVRGSSSSLITGRCGDNASSVVDGEATAVQSTCCGLWGAILASRRTVDELHRKYTLDTGLQPGAGDYPSWQREVKMRGYYEDYAGDSPLTGDPGYDVCGFASHSVSIPPRKYYTYKTVTGGVNWDGRCPRHVCSISYTNNSITISIGGKTYCEEATIIDCPSLVAQLPAHAYISAENIGSSNNSDDNAMQINLPSQKQTFQTLTYTHKEYLGGMSGADVNSGGAVSTAMGHKCGLFTKPYCHSASAGAACGGTTFYTSNIRDSYGTFGMALASWKSRMIEAFNNIDSEIGAEFGWNPRGLSGAAGDAGAERARHKCNANNHISSSDIVQGIIPGTCSDIQFETTSKSYPKYGYDGQEIVASTATQYTVRAYIEYTYKRPVTIQDKLKGWSADSDSYACAQEGKNRTSQHNEGAQDDYPEWYAQSLGLETRDTLGYPIQNYGGSSNYVRRKIEVSKSSSCGENLTSYTPEDYNKGENAKYPYGGAPCGRNDYLCWSKNRDWIRVWTDHSYE